jgi:initiation factor 1A
MVKNKKGGSSHKKMARKFVNNNSGPRKLRKAKLKDGEIYAKVLQMYGNGMCNVICSDNIERLCIIRRRFKGRNKRDNMVGLNSILLVGRREWELVADNKKQKVDLLYVYNESDIKELIKDEGFGEIVCPESEHDKDKNDYGVEFTNNINYEEEEEECVVENKKVVHNKRVTKYKPKVLEENKKEDDDEIDMDISFDDI